ncbi:MAG: hypothetical protein JXR96_22845 [Deltaproteobacteria bacterium]|nr:hypothetical protein [Deltaproteobacteria bacterium]
MSHLIAAAVLELFVLCIWILSLLRARFDFQPQADPESVLGARRVRDFVQPLRLAGFEPLGVATERVGLVRSRMAVYANGGLGIYALLYPMGVDTGLQLLSLFDGGGLVVTQRGYFVRERREPNLIARGLAGRLGVDELLAAHRADRGEIERRGQAALPATAACLPPLIEREERSSYERARRRQARIGSSVVLAITTALLAWVLWSRLGS